MPRSDDAPGLLTRLGLAIAGPRWALALADEPDHAGRAGTDLIRLLALSLVAIHTRELMAAGWLAAVIDARLGARALVDLLGRSVTTTLALLLIGAMLTWLAAGSRRALGRDFDLACVAVVPLIVVELVATLVVRTSGVAVPAAASWAIAGVGYGWTAALVVLAIAQARRRRRSRARTGSDVVANLPAASRRAGSRAGLCLLALIVAALVVNGGWVIRHLDWLRPMSAGDRAPAFALPRIEAGGALGAEVRSDQLADRVVVLDFWATWCKPCRRALPELSALAARGAGRIEVLSINLDDAEAARAMFDDKGYRSTLVGDAGDAAERFGVRDIPHLVVVDRRGVVRMVARGDHALHDVIELAEHLALP